MLRKNTAGQHLGFALVKAADGTALTGAAVTGKRQIDGAAQAAVTGSFTEGGNGQYNFSPSAADVNGNQVSFLFTATSAVPVEKTVVTTAANPTDGVAFGLTVFPTNFALTTIDGAGHLTLVQAFPTNFSALSIDASGNCKIQTGVKKNTALANYQFLMTDSTNHVPVTGKAPVCTRVIDGGAFAAGTLAGVAEISNGMYRVNFAAADLNGLVVTLRATAAGCDDAFITFVTMP